MQAKSLFYISLILLFLNVSSYGFNDGTGLLKSSPNNVILEENQMLVYNFREGDYYNLSVYKVYEGTYVRVFLPEKGVEYLKDTVIEIAQEFDENIYSKMTDTFGYIPYEKIDIVFYDVQDFYSTFTLNYYAGYFDADYEENRNRIFIDIYPTFAFESIESIEGIIAHEFQHLIHYFHDYDEMKWLNEGMSELSTYVLGGENLVHVEEYLNYPYFSLDSWSNTLADYGKVYLFFRYLMLRKGFKIIKDIVAHDYNGINSVDKVLNGDFEDIFSDFSVALSTDDDEFTRYDIPGLDISINPMYTLTEKNMSSPVELEKYSFYMVDYYFKYEGIRNIDFSFETNNDLRVYTVLYSKGNPVLIRELENGINIFEESFNYYRLIIVNPTGEILKNKINITFIDPEFSYITNPYVSENRVFAVKGDITNLEFNGEKIPLFTNENYKGLNFFKVNIELMKSNNFEYRYIYSDKEYKGVTIFRQGEL